MTMNNAIIDVTPIEHSSSRIVIPDSRAANGEGAGSAGWRGDASGWNASSPRQGFPHDGIPPFVGGQSSSDWAGAGTERTFTSPGSVIGGLAQAVVGAGLIAIGIPMLILPGPGLLSIGAGALLVARGAGKVFRM